MLKPAILYKEELLKLFAKELYTDRYFYYTGSDTTMLPRIEAENEKYQYAIVDNDEVVGFFAYSVWDHAVQNFGLYSFKENNTSLGKDVFIKMRELVKTYRRVEWRMIGGNKIQEAYDRFCEKYGGNHVVLHEVARDPKGILHDEHFYEIINKNSGYR